MQIRDGGCLKMRKMKLLQLRATNFMNTHDETFRFFDKTMVSARNGVGKSTLINAYMWLLFDADAELHSNPPVRRTVDGEPVNDMDVSIEGIFDIDGKIVTARKVQKRKFKKDGSGYSDDNTYFINDVPKTLKAFNEYFEVDMKILQMCSNVNAFLQKKDKDIREYLFSKVENITDLDIAKSNERLAELITLLEKYSREEIEAMNKASVSKVNNEIPILDGQIKEKERDVAENSDIDLAELELQKKSLKEQIADNESKQNDISKQLSEYDRMSTRIMELKFEQGDLQRKANEENVKQRNEIENKISDKKFLLSQAEKIVRDTEREITNLEDGIQKDSSLLKKIREEYKTVQALKFDENSLICKYCGQEYPSDKKEQIKADFEDKKASDLQAITVKGNNINTLLKEQKLKLEELEKELPQHVQSVNMLNESISSLQVELNKLPQSIDISGTEEYKVIQSEISELQAKLSGQINFDDIKKSLKEEFTRLNSELIEVEKRIAKADISEKEARLEELRQQRIDLEQKKTDCQKILDLLKELDKEKNETLVDSINAMFGLVKWQLFDFAKNGGYKSVCVPMVDNKSILSLASNKGNRILGRVDIVNSIQKIEGLNVPVFLDDVESLDDENIKKAVSLLNCQVIILKVTNGEKLRFEEIIE